MEGLMKTGFKSLDFEILDHLANADGSKVTIEVGKRDWVDSVDIALGLRSLLDSANPTEHAQTGPRTQTTTSSSST